MTITLETWQVMILNLPNFVGFVVAVWVLDRRLSSLEGLLGNVLDRCLPEDVD